MAGASVDDVEAFLVEDAQDLFEVMAALENLATQGDHLVHALAVSIGGRLHHGEHGHLAVAAENREHR